MPDISQKRGKRVWRYTMRDIEEASGVPMATLKVHRIQGKLNPDEMISVAAYIMSYRLKALAAATEQSDEKANQNSGTEI